MNGARLDDLMNEARVSRATLASHLGESLEALEATLSSDSVPVDRVRAIRWGIEELSEDDIMFRTYRMDFITVRGRRNGYDISGESFDMASQIAILLVPDLANGMVRVSNPDGATCFRVIESARPDNRFGGFKSRRRVRVGQDEWLEFFKSRPKTSLGDVRSSIASKRSLEELAMLVEEVSFHDRELAGSAARMLADFIQHATDATRTEVWRAAQHADRVAGVDDVRRAAAKFHEHPMDKVLFHEDMPRDHRGGRKKLVVTWRGIHNLSTDQVEVCSMFNEPGQHPEWARDLVSRMEQGRIFNDTQKTSWFKASEPM